MNRGLFKIIKNNISIIIESLIAIALLILNTFSSETTDYNEIIRWCIFALLIIDIIFKLNDKYKSKRKEEQLKKENEEKDKQQSESLESIQKGLDEQKKFNFDYKEKNEKSLKILNKFFSESLLNENDILKLAKSSQYYILYVYSWPFKYKIKKDKNKINRQYPIFLKDIGFIRMGLQASFFIINKDKLKQKELHNIVEFKKYLNKNFERIRKKEFDLYLKNIKGQDKKCCCIKLSFMIGFRKRFDKYY